MPRERLILFTRYPIAGKTKTRLIPEIGAEAAAETQRQLTELTLHRAKALAIARGVGIEVRFEGGDARLIRDWLGPMPRYTPQGVGVIYPFRVRLHHWQLLASHPMHAEILT